MCDLTHSIFRYFIVYDDKAIYTIEPWAQAPTDCPFRFTGEDLKPVHGKALQALQPLIGFVKLECCAACIRNK